MKFCPKCDLRLRKSDSGLKCPECGYLESRDAGAKRPASSEQGVSEFNVIDDNEKEMRSTTKTDCPKCGHDEAAWWMIQTRSADEPSTRFYRCTKCSHTWRDYS